MTKLQQAWELHPELRLCQLISNLVGYGISKDIFFVEENTIDAALDNFIAQYAAQQKEHDKQP